MNRSKLSSVLSSRKLLILGVMFLAFVLRIWNVTQLSPYWEEVAIGYDAYSILKTGKDHHGHPFPIVAFESFGDYKPTLYFYSVVPFILVFGLNVLAVRLPSVIAGTLIVWGAGLIAREVVSSKYLVDNIRTKDQKGVLFANLLDIQLIAMLVTAISPWAIMFSRAGWEVNLATCFVTFGIFAGMRSLHAGKLKNFSVSQVRFGWFFISAVLLIFSMYTYHVTRIVAPLLGVLISLPWVAELIAHKGRGLRPLLIAGAVVGILGLPLLLSLGQKNTSQRFAETSIFSDISIIEESNHLIAEDGGTVVARLIHHRYVLFGREIVKNALSHFHPNFLFVTGDTNPRHSVQLLGQLYMIEAIFLLIGLYSLLNKNRKAFWLLFIWTAIVLLPVSMTKATPHALRTLPMMPVFMILIASGIQQVLAWSPNRRWCYSTGAIIGIMYVGFFSQFWHVYMKVYPKVYAQEWQFGYQEMVNSVNELRQPNEDVYITREQGRPAMYYWFFSQTKPDLVQRENITARKDQGEFLQFDKFHFVDGLNGQEKGLIVSSAKTAEVFAGREIVQEIKNPKQETVWVVFRQ